MFLPAHIYSKGAADIDPGKKFDRPATRYRKAQVKLKKAKTEKKRFWALGRAALTAVEMKKYGEAEEYAKELLSLAPNYRQDWNYGNAIHDSHTVLGRIDLMQGNVDRAKEHLLQAGKTTGSIQLKSFGPNMSLANDLLNKGEKEIVIKYLDLCSVFWERDEGRIETWRRKIKRGEKPDFGRNLLY